MKQKLNIRVPLGQGGANSTELQGPAELFRPLAAPGWEARRMRYGLWRFWQVKLVALLKSPVPLYMASSG